MILQGGSAVNPAHGLQLLIDHGGHDGIVPGVVATQSGQLQILQDGVKAQVNGNFKNTAVEVRANTSSDAKWILQAIYGFHAVLAAPVEEREILTTEDSSQPVTPEQQRIASLKTAKDRAGDALKAERDRQKKQNAMKTLRSLPLTPSS